MNGTIKTEAKYIHPLVGTPLKEPYTYLGNNPDKVIYRGKLIGTTYPANELFKQIREESKLDRDQFATGELEQLTNDLKKLHKVRETLNERDRKFITEGLKFIRGEYQVAV